MFGNARLLYRFNADVLSVQRDADRITLEIKNWRPLAFTLPKAAFADAVMALQDAGATLSKLVEIAGAAGDEDRAAKAVSYYIERFARGRLLAWDLADDEGELAKVESLAASYRPREDDPPEGELSLCRFAYLRSEDAATFFGSGLVRARILPGARGMAAIAELLARPRRADENALAVTLWRLGFFDIAGSQKSDARRCWEFQDLLLHETSRGNRDASLVGASYRFDGQFPSPPAIKPAMAGERTALPKVDPERVRQASQSLDAVQQRRRSLRAYADKPISLAALGEFLWRVCRTKEHMPDKRQDLIARPYPAGGSINELEYYPVIRRCDGLAAAVYHYDSHRHELVRLANSEKVAAKIISASAAAMALGPDDQPPDLTLVIASRLPRLAWKYQGMAYRASLMNAGVVFHLMYLVATDMGLAPCANGSGDSRLLQEATGLDQFEETAIAEFCLGMPA